MIFKKRSNIENILSAYHYINGIEVRYVDQSKYCYTVNTKLRKYGFDIILVSNKQEITIKKV